MKTPSNMTGAEEALYVILGNLAGLATIHPDPTVRAAADMLNGAVSGLVAELIGRESAEKMFEDVIEILNPEIEPFGLKITTTKELKAEAVRTTDDLIERLRKGGL